MRVAALRYTHPEAEYFIPHDIAYAAGVTEAEWRRTLQASDEIIDDLSRQLRRQLDNPRLVAVTWSWAYNSGRQFRVFREPAIEDTLQRRFHREALGEYTFWVRNGVP